MTSATHPVVVASGVRIRREDGQVLVVQHHDGIAAGRWSLPFAGVAEHEVAEATATRLLRDVLHLDPGQLEFAHTLTIPGTDADVVVNVFDAIGWLGEPRYSGRAFDDAGWIDPANAGADVVPEVAEWLSGTAAIVDPYDELVRALLASREVLLAAYDAIPEGHRERELIDERAPVDVLQSALVFEAYAMDEVVRLIQTSGHVWRELNEAQSEVERRLRPRPATAAVRDRAVRTQTETFHMLETFMPEDLVRYGNHPTRGVIPVRACIDDIAANDRNATAHLRAMLDIVRRESN